LRGTTCLHSGKRWRITDRCLGEQAGSPQQPDRQFSPEEREENRRLLRQRQSKDQILGSISVSSTTLPAACVPESGLEGPENGLRQRRNRQQTLAFVPCIICSFSVHSVVILSRLCWHVHRPHLETQFAAFSIPAPGPIPLDGTLSPTVQLPPCRRSQLVLQRIRRHALLFLSSSAYACLCHVQGHRWFAHDSDARRHRYWQLIVWSAFRSLWAQALVDLFDSHVFHLYLSLRTRTKHHSPPMSRPMASVAPFFLACSLHASFCGCRKTSKSLPSGDHKPAPAPPTRRNEDSLACRSSSAPGAP
jgi:hypothetical protein